MKRVAVLGAGRVGSLIAADLAADDAIAVTVADASAEALGRLSASCGAHTVRADLSSPAELARVLASCDAAVGAVPGHLGARVLRAAIEAGRPIADIAFAPEDPLELDGLARERGVPAIVDCGVAPGLSNLLVGRSVAELDRADSARILVGGLPVRRVWPWEYRAVFSPTDVVEEYTRPSRLRRAGAEVVRPALTEIERIDLPGVGTVEAFLTDGLRTLLRTIPLDDLEEKTLRWPGHAEKVLVLRETGFLDEVPVEVGGVALAPRALTEALLFRAWELGPGEPELTVLRVEVRGRRAGRDVAIVWELVDRTDPGTGATSMARTTGFPCAIAVRLLLDGTWTRPGVHPPEVLGGDAVLVARFRDELAARGVHLTRSEG